MKSEESLKTLYATVLIIIMPFGVFYLWQNALLITAFLTLLITLMLWCEKKQIKIVLLIAALAFILSPLYEGFMASSGAWTFARQDIANVPIWISFVWASIIIYTIRVYRYLSTK